MGHVLYVTHYTCDIFGVWRIMDVAHSWRSDMCHKTYSIWLIHMCHMTPSHAWRSDMWHILYVTRYICRHMRRCRTYMYTYLYIYIYIHIYICTYTCIRKYIACVYAIHAGLIFACMSVYWVFLIRQNLICKNMGTWIWNRSKLPS